MRVIFTCGGTGGHINPALAVAKLLQSKRPSSEILFVGAQDGMENTLVPLEGFRLETIKISNFQRKITPVSIAHNLKTGVNMVGSLSKASKIIKEFKPDVILGTGGYASYPTLKKGAELGIPTAVLEANAVPGLATRLVANSVNKILVGFEESRSAFSHPERVVTVGNPVREEFIYTKSADAKKKLGLDERPLVVSYWGSLGAREMNKIIARFIKLKSTNDSFWHIHATGSYGWRWMPDYVKGLGVDLESCPTIDMREYIYDMPTVMNAADLVICRAGASTLSEISACGKPSIIVPSPNVTDNHHEKNARILEQRGAARVILEKDCTGDILYSEVVSLLADKTRLDDMKTAVCSVAILDSTERIYNVICELAGK